MVMMNRDENGNDVMNGDDEIEMKMEERKKGSVIKRWKRSKKEQRKAKRNEIKRQKRTRKETKIKERNKKRKEAKKGEKKRN